MITEQLKNAIIGTLDLSHDDILRENKFNALKEFADEIEVNPEMDELDESNPEDFKRMKKHAQEMMHKLIDKANELDFTDSEFYIFLEMAGFSAAPEFDY